MRTTIHGMNIFVRAVETNSFTEAARSLLIDPTGVSRAIKALETELGILLFARSTRVLKLTAEGARFYRDCVRILRSVEEATEKFRHDRTQPHGLLKVGMAPGLSRRMLMRSIPGFQEAYPAIEIVLLNIDDVSKVGDKGIDVLIRGRSLRQRGGQRSESQGLVVRKLAQLHYVVCASPEYLERAEAPRIPADLDGHACISTVTLEHDIRSEWQFVKSRARQKVKIRSKLFVHGVEATREAGVAGCGIIRLGAGHIEDELRSGQLVAVLTDWECAGAPPIVAIYRKTIPAVPQINVFVRHLTEAFRRYENLPE
jgi:DNA-binding transcriptional LysR family regulator